MSQLNVTYQSPTVKAFHFDERNLEYEAQNGIPETTSEFNFFIVTTDDDKQQTKLTAFLQTMIVQNTYVISAFLTQDLTLNGRIVKKQSDLSKDEMSTLIAPLLDVLKRMTHDVTTTAFDKPGLNIEF